MQESVTRTPGRVHTLGQSANPLRTSGERPPAKAGGFRLRLKAGSVRPSADYTTLKSSSGSGGFCFLM